MDEIIIEKNKQDLAEVELEINQNKIITKLEDLEVTPSQIEQNFRPEGAYRKVKVKGDENLIAENIKSGTSIFGVQGKSANTDDATAGAGNIDKGQIAYGKNNARLVGTSPRLDAEAEPYMLPFVGVYYGGKGTIIKTSDYVPLVYGTSARGEYGKTVLFPKSKLPEDIEGKNIVLRYSPDNTGNSSYPGHSLQAELFIAPSMDDWFEVRRDSQRDLIRCWSADKNTRVNYHCYRFVLNGQGHTLDEITSDKWEDKGWTTSGVNSYSDNSWYRFSTKDTISKGGLGQGTSYQGRGDDCYGKVVLNKYISHTKLAEGGTLLYRIPNTEVAKTINLKAEDIKEGKTYLGVTGTMPNNNANLEITEESLDFSTDRSLPQLTLTTIDFTGMDLSKIKHWHYAFWNYKKLKEVKGIDFVNPNTSAYWMFCGCDSLEIFPEMKNTQNVVDFARAFQECKKLKTIEYFDTSNANDLSYMCIGCSELVNFPALNASKTRIGGLSDMFSNCPNLSDESLNNILAMCISANATHANAAYGNKSLTQYLKLTSTQANKCKSLSNWSAFIAAGWTA